jgi:hypothetical protein
MSYTTFPAYIQYAKGWETRFQEHPVMDWLSDYEVAFDTGDMKSGPHTPWHADDYSFTKPTGECITGGAPAWAAFLEMYRPFSAHFLEPFFFIIWETPTGYELIGTVRLFGNLAVPGERTQTDLQGRKWDIGAPGATHLKFVKDPSGPKGLKLNSEEVFTDGIPVIGEMIKRGMVTPEQILGTS